MTPKCDVCKKDLEKNEPVFKLGVGTFDEDWDFWNHTDFKIHIECLDLDTISEVIPD